MIDAPTCSLLQDIIRRESRSLLQYVSDCFPWVLAQDRAMLVRLNQLIEEERRGAAGLVRILLRAHQPPPYIGSYPSVFTNINFVSLEHLLPMLIDNERRAIGGLERDLTCLYDADAREAVQDILALKRRHLQELEKMAAGIKKHAPPVAG